MSQPHQKRQKSYFCENTKSNSKQANRQKATQHQRTKELFLNLSVCLIPNKNCVLYKAVVVKLERAWKSTGGLVKGGLLGPTCRVSGSLGLGWGSSTCIPTTFPSETEASGPGTTLGE